MDILFESRCYCKGEYLPKVILVFNYKYHSAPSLLHVTHVVPIDVDTFADMDMVAVWKVRRLK